jgi:4-amino-4-deoxy-L-arabinose transferase-like glycosyltransferase
MTETKTTDEDRQDRDSPVAKADASVDKDEDKDEDEDKDKDKADAREKNGSSKHVVANGTAPADGPAEKAEESAKDSAATEEEPTGDILIAPGNPLNKKRGILTILGGGVPAFLLMAKNGQNGWAIPVGFVFVLVCAFGVMDLLGTFDDAEEHVEGRTTLSELLPSLGAVLALTVGFGALLSLAQSASLPGWLSSILVPVSFLGLVAAIFRVGQILGPWKTDELGLERPLWSRHGFWVIVAGALLYFPALGLFSLWDPWETHYGEVAREILSRDDWISLWWAQDGWFWSKPILNFWIQSLAMGSLGTHFQPDQMLMAGGAPVAHPEWVVRTPNVLMTIGAMYLLYKGVAKVFGRRAGLLGAFVLATMPDWYFLAHQTMTDMPFVGAMTAAMGLLLYGLNTDEEARVKVYEVEAFGRKLRFSLWHVVFGAILLCAIPQILYLASRNIELVAFGSGPKGFRLHWDEFKSGSAGNCGLPGNEACVAQNPASIPKSDSWFSPAKHTGVMVYLRLFSAFEPLTQGVVWAVVLGAVLYLNWGERRARRLIYIAAWLCAAIATMAKGPAGFGLPIICAFAYVATKRRWRELLNFELVTGLLVIVAVALPWYVAMYVRHGSPFTDRLIFHDMFNRAFSHVHDTNEGDDTGLRYYIWQFGYAAFPWSGLCALGMLWGFRRSDSALARIGGLLSPKEPAPLAATAEGAGATPPVPAGAAVGDASVMLVMWCLFAFALFSFMGTKFHHYIFPAIPPAAMLVGVVLDDMLGAWRPPPLRSLIVYAGGFALVAVVAVFGASKLWAGSVFGAKPDANASGSPAAAIVLVGIAMALYAAIVASNRRRARDEDAPPAAVVADPSRSPFRGGVSTEVESAAETQRKMHEQLMLGGAALAAALVTLVIGRDLALNVEGGEGAGAVRLLQLFTYNYKRPYPSDSVDFSAVLWGFTVIGAAVGATLAVKKLRRHAVVAMCSFALVWALWGLEVYMTTLSPHWGQHEVIEAYYRDRKSPDEILVAYQMNWKGENFYTGNHVPAFVSTGATFQTWLKKEKEKGTKVMYFITEHSRTSGLRSEVAAKSYKEITDKALNNKFVVIRAEF